jgi:hypothetical protein
MSTPYTPVPTYHSQISVTVDGDPADANEFNTPYQQCADNAAFCRSVIDPLINGGTFSPAGNITFNCSLAVDSIGTTNACSVGTLLSVLGNSQLFGLVQCFNGLQVVSGNASVAGSITSTGGNIATVSGAINSGGDLNVAGTSSLLGALSVSGNSTLGGSVTLTGSVVSPIAFTGSGRALDTFLIWPDSGSHTVSAKYQNIYIDPSTTNNLTVTIDTDHEDGDHVYISYPSSSHTITIDFAGTAGQALGATGSHWVYAVCMGGVYKLMGSGA